MKWRLMKKPIGYFTANGCPVFSDTEFGQHKSSIDGRSEH